MRKIILSTLQDLIFCMIEVNSTFSLIFKQYYKINKLECFEIQLKDCYWRESNLTDQIYTCLLNSCSFNNPQNKKGCLTGFIGLFYNSCNNKNKAWGQQYGLKDQNCYLTNTQISIKG
ncbi:hypothetical protein TTHERM_01328980 (macronuclear) [Tetrahymena thermophila SB210]|uniref:Transmembrane protein n=1 Tax=Tetrahymena thermophila (strain SB210) TaxID=312017 RepID=Q23CQ5_TETTS|nr:hypothetical protein TTHERM_01328980 [Tetrahymena thermophila SB210]EAR94320.1 hypothetical protein TTHERM_01328980 [Tetrahymena thermophila SB210]|eukprot:XP_001014565.1 hypothetical protein TTHERM_01328980 [Tetrahymena thermophila SB210]